ncbi:hypothetical protein MCOR27_004742 [Pyricularia oryzae]|uniref:Uncharacterized protein n=5 Tax=Pyricularia TaxID=48558 RepID=A0ABQ8NS85_PYRGI|nr:uncharacterized protein MGG_10892 [Pyricularia oryzae 70-15]ELQ32923.1 hypothetical protein OOU_Y34scaffold01014g2 [Pyricularia oryzae Y34]KAH8845036.1 hypothetical protein MCOR01_002290 [Pyricularia oryzae]KAI6301404.1 hypothetical protein MCOR33_003079 [Pyricularia grisea]EHA58132.1 hypothetical protein MGG_10892 [Pyricularia oryzae 70-15]KAH9429121.1 hypothetical protein MCOR02_010531 [Pyricularia oryzae]
MFGTTYAVLGSLALATLAAALPLEPRNPQAQPPANGTPGVNIPGINIPGQNGQGGFNLGPGGFTFGNPENGGGGVTWGSDGLKITPGNGNPGISVGGGQPAQPAPKPPRRVLDEQDLSVEEED